MLQSMGLERVRQDCQTEQQQRIRGPFMHRVLAFSPFGSFISGVSPSILDTVIILNLVL